MKKNNRILIVDDQKDLCEQLAKLLQQVGKSNETLSLVQQMRARLIGGRAETSSNLEADKENSLYEVESVNQGQDAAEKISQSLADENPYALVFLDMRMPPGWDGLETAKKIRELDKDVEIVIMTAYADHDQKQISEQVGHPEKLLYIKKPFQAEEIYQLALSLTTKWNLEWTEKRRKKWLESIIKGLCKLKNNATSHSISATFVSALKTFLDMMDSEKGFATSLEGTRWKLHCCNGMSEDSALTYINENLDFFTDCRTTKHKDDKYFMPLKKDAFTGMIVIFEVKAKNDPEWYKLLSILSMTVSDILGDHVAAENGSTEKNKALLSDIFTKLSESSAKHIDLILSQLALIREECASQLILDILSKALSNANDMELDLRNATLCVSGAKPIIQTLQISPALKNGLHIGSHGRAVCKIEGDEKIEVKADFDMLKNVFANLARSSLERCKMGDIWIEAHISVEDKKVKITYSDNGSGIPKEKQEKLFSPFDKDAMSEMGLPVVALVLKELAGSIRLDQNYSGDGTKFIIELPVP